MADENGTLHSCSPYNFLNATVFRANRNLVLESLRKKISTNRFGTDLQGNGLDPVYGLAQCRADLPLSHCSQCFEKAEEELELLCPTQNGGRVFVDGCFLRYENASIFTQLFDSGISNCSSSSNSSAVKFSDITGKLLGETVGKALTNNSFAIAWTVESDSSINIYALAQCWTSLTTQGCQTCLQEAQNLIQNCLPSTEGEVLEAGCYLRYATYPFFSPNGITATNLSGGSKSKTVGIILGIIGGAVLVMAAAFFAWSKLRKRSFPNKWRKRAWSGGELELGENSAWFDYEDLREATGNFDSENKIGEGGFGEVYKGTLRDGREIAVKRLFDSESSAATAEFSTEMELISSVCHRNLVTVLGCCTLQNQRFLVFEYMANRSLNRHLFGLDLNNI